MTQMWAQRTRTRSRTGRRRQQFDVSCVRSPGIEPQTVGQTRSPDRVSCAGSAETPDVNFKVVRQNDKMDPKLLA